MRLKLIALPVLATLLLAGCAKVDTTAAADATKAATSAATSAAASADEHAGETAEEHAAHEAAGATPPAAPTANPADVAADLKTLEAVTVDTSGAIPTLKGKFPITLKATSAKQVKAGTGEAIKAGDQVTLKTVVFDLKDGKQQSETFSAGGQASPFSESAFPPEIIKVIKDPKIGVVGQYAVLDPTEGKSMMVVFQIDKPEPIKPAAVVDKAKLPTVTLADGKKPTYAKPTAAAPTDTQMAVLKEGTGAVVKAGQNLTVRYTGWTWADGKEFDSSFNRDPNTTAFDIGTGGVIPCWDKAIVGQKLGSTLELACSATDAYGENTGGGQPAGALVFVVELVSAK